MIPARATPKMNCIKPAMTTATRNISNDPHSCIPTNTIAARHAAGPLTPKCDPLNMVTTIPPTIPAMIPENSGAPEASAMPKQSGTATRKTTRPAGASFFKLENKLFFIGKVFSRNTKNVFRIGVIQKFWC